MKSQAFGFELRIESAKYAAGIALIDRVTLLRIEVDSRFNVTLGIVIVVACLRVYAAHGADHLRSKQNIFDWDDTREQINARLMVDAGIKVNVIEQMVLEQRLFQLLRQASETTPVVRHCATAMGNEELQGWKILEQITR